LAGVTRREVLGLIGAATVGTAAATGDDPPELDRAIRLLRAAPLIDTHNDLPWNLQANFDGDLSRIDLKERQPGVAADIPRLRQGCVGAQYWAVYTESATRHSRTALRDAMQRFDVIHRMIGALDALEFAGSADDIERIHRSGRIASLIGVEGGHMIDNSLATLRIFHRLGARYLTLTHGDTLEWADSATDRPLHEGLTEFGEDVVRELNRLGMFADISHVSPDTMRDVLRVSRAPVIFSHSNAYAVDPHPRNVPDDVLEQLPRNGGVIHVNFIWSFVTPRHIEWQAARRQALRGIRAWVDDEAAVQRELVLWEAAVPRPSVGIAQVADHIDHIRKIAGVAHIGIGADFFDSGQSSMVRGLNDASRYPYLFAELLRRGYTDEEVLGIAGRNHLRAMRQMESAAHALRREPARIAEHPSAG
jgi:membrane dipeptidase